MNIRFTDTTLRDAQQSLIATRMTTDEMLPALENIDAAGYWSAEVWGGATFDSCLRFLNEDPWRRLKAIKKVMRKTPLQMLFRGQNILGYRAYHDDVVEAFALKSAEYGIDVFRLFDALNDLTNLETAVKAVKKAGKHAQLCVAYTTSEIHTIKYFTELTRRLADMGADSVCVKDMAGLLLPNAAAQLVGELKKTAKLPVHVHSHCTSGLAYMSYMSAAVAGADVLDVCSSPFSGGTSQPAAEVMNAALVDLGFETGFNAKPASAVADYFKPLRDKAIDGGLLDVKALNVDVDMLTYQVPGGMLSNLVSQLKQAGALDKYDAALKEIPAVRADLGMPPLVTPTSQIVGTQAVMNVMAGERYKIVPKETKDLVRGLYGQTPAPISAEIRQKIAGGEDLSVGRRERLQAPSLPAFEAELGRLKEYDCDVLSYAMFPQVAAEFFKARQAGLYGADPRLVSDGSYPV